MKGHCPKCNQDIPVQVKIIVLDRDATLRDMKTNNEFSGLRRNPRRICVSFQKHHERGFFNRKTCSESSANWLFPCGSDDVHVAYRAIEEGKIKIPEWKVNA